MLKNITFGLIKPDAIKKGYTSFILNMINNTGFKIIALKMTLISQIDAKRFYYIHSKKSFFESMTKFISSGPIVVTVLEKKNAVEDFRTIIGSTNPKESEKGTIRNLYAESIEKNAIHGSDSYKNAIKEITFFFSKREIYINNIFI